MDKHELQELLTATKLEKDMYTGVLTDEEYDALEKLYLVLDLEKPLFAKIVKAVGVYRLVERENLWQMTLTAMDEYEAKSQYQCAMARAKEIQNELARLDALIAAYKESNGLT